MKAGMLAQRNIAAASNGSQAVAVIRFHDGDAAVLRYAPRSSGLPQHAAEFSRLAYRALDKLDARRKESSR